MSTEGMDALNTQKDANRYLNEKIVEAQDSITEVSEALTMSLLGGRCHCSGVGGT